MNIEAVNKYMATAPVAELMAINRQANVELSRRNSGRATTEAVIAAVADRYGVTAGELKGARGSNAVSVVRYVAYAAVREARPHLSYSQIGKAFGGRDHSTIIDGIQKHEARLIWVDFLIWAAKGGEA
ncbi:helix-turn-helix domain-containing protein [Brevundimonas faecalis]|uniref:helix-turn-helix domain-containing protein n=1 Tax=Brevundimonas faecalis TaxID=947378 RepID=UPI00361150EA